MCGRIGRDVPAQSSRSMALPSRCSWKNCRVGALIDEVLPGAQVHVEFQKRVMGALASSARVESIRANAVFAVFPRLRGQR